MKIIEINFGNTRFAVDVDKLSRKKIEEVYVKLVELEERQHPYRKFQIMYPRLENESDEDWKNRVKAEVEKEITKHEGESDLDYLKRLAKQDMKEHITSKGLDVVNIVAEVLNMTPIGEGDYDETAWSMIEPFLFDVLTRARLPQAVWFQPEKTYKQLQQTV